MRIEEKEDNMSMIHRLPLLAILCYLQVFNVIHITVEECLLAYILVFVIKYILLPLTLIGVYNLVICLVIIIADFINIRSEYIYKYAVLFLYACFITVQ